MPDLAHPIVGGPARWPLLIDETCAGCGGVFQATQDDDAIRDLRAAWRREHAKCVAGEADGG